MSFSNPILRYAMIGTGMMGCEHIRNLKAISGCEIVAISDLHQPSREAAASLLPSVRQFSDYREMLAEVELDVVVISTPNHTSVKMSCSLLGNCNLTLFDSQTQWFFDQNMNSNFKDIAQHV